ncbi:MAG TPA: tagaturonate reductase [Chitinophagaceae bacterium]|nr:tagaturonate reductase [Chitinophagaceae bacterium]
MKLSKEAIGQIAVQSGLELPGIRLFELPEKVLQFGTGVLLRGLPDYFIDKANKQGIFNGRVVIVKSTDSDSSAFDKQNGLYTICVRGIENGKTVEENIINASVSRVLSAKTEWKRILECSHNPEIKIIISNTTEVGIQLTEDNINNEPPVSFPGKLLAFLLERYNAFNGSAESGMVIIPTELITDNGSKLEGIVQELAHRHNLDFTFIEWLETHNTFCNSLVDRIVPGKPGKEAADKLENFLGYTDDLLIMSEVFRLWAIEGNEKIKAMLSFCQADDAVVITPDITLFKELKLRLLNGTHTFNCGLAFLAGFNITREAVTDKIFSVFAKNLMHSEIAKAIPFEIEEKVKEDFASKVFERFCNPFIDHQWLSITTQYTSKMKMRNVPLIEKHYEVNSTPPMHMATGFAGYLLFMKAIKKSGNKYFAERKDPNGYREEYEIKDDTAEYFYNAWNNNSADRLAKEVMENEELWGIDMARLPGFLASVQEQLQELMTNGVLQTLSQLNIKKETA